MAVNEPVLKEIEKPGARPQPRVALRTLLFFFALLGVLVAAGVVAGMLPRRSRAQALAAASRGEQQQLPRVNAALVRLAPSRSELELPGDLQALIESPIYARADGYLKRRLVDYGDHVKTGQLLAEIETPELDQQISQARASLAQSQTALKQLQANLTLSQANMNLARITYDRWKRLAEAGVFSRQDADEKEANFAVTKAQVEAAQASINTALETVKVNEANLRRLEEMKAFARVTAPFDGIVTARNVDVGTLINSGNGGPAREMFRMAQIDRLRIFVNVPQTFVESVRAGQSADLHVQELPGQIFRAEVTRISNALDPSSRAMLAVLEVPNPRGILLPGMYAQVKFAIPRQAPALVLPGDALVLGREGPRVAVVDAGSKVHYRKIHIGRDLGAELEVDSGVAAGEWVVVNPTDAVREGVTVEVRK